MNPQSPFPESPFTALDTLWLQVAGTICNLACTHCFISCSPSNHRHGMMSLAEVRRRLDEGSALGVREYYLTGGEPFLNGEILPILEAVLGHGPATVLTNGLLLDPATAGRLRELSDASAYSLDLRISLDGWDAAGNDPIRGAGTFTRILQGIRNVATVGLSPVITVTEACEEAASAAGRTRLLAFLAEIGLTHPRLKVLPLLLLGAETARSRGYTDAETLHGRVLSAEETASLQCTSSRTVTADGVYVCPILLDAPEARMSHRLTGSLRPYTLAHRACYTCVTEGLSCRT